MTKTPLTAREAIATYLSADYADMENDHRYQSTRTSIPVYSFGNSYFCSPSATQKLPRGFDWRAAGTVTVRGVSRDIYRAGE